MTDPKETAPDPMDEPMDVIDLSSPELWSSRQFHGMILQGLQKDGFGADVIALVAKALDHMAEPSYAGLRAGLMLSAADQTPTLKQELERLVEFLDETIEFNNRIYQINDGEAARVKRWPNHLGIKARYPEQYFDIFEDFFFVEPNRFITKDTPIGSAGSCFALRIAHQLQQWDYNYVIEEDDLPEDFPIENLSSTSYRMAPARMGTLFNVPSIRQMVERAFYHQARRSSNPATNRTRECSST